MTVLIGLACLAVAGLEMVMAFIVGPREREALRQEVKSTFEERMRKLEAAQRKDEIFETEQETRLHTLEDDLGGLRLRIVQVERDLQARVGGLGQDLHQAIGQVNALEDDRDRINGLQRRLTQAFQTVDEVVADLLRHTLAQLDQETAETLGERAADTQTIRGAIACATTEFQGALVQIFEQCTRHHDLELRFKVSMGGARPQEVYYLTGRSPRWLRQHFADVLQSLRSDMASPAEDPAEDDVAALQSLLHAVNATGEGFAQIGPVVIVRTQDTLLCGVLTLAECRDFDTATLAGDPIASAVRLRTLPPHRLFDLTEWPPRFPAEEQPGDSSSIC
ncbi:MAG: hypothetical protein JWN52_6422 [Actinomycetia bacterium]|jgi:hypothetical protein|nr:hypothetical protein [Actinomycetes bacterium]